MKRFLAWWREMPRLHVQFVKSGSETNPLARRAIESLQKSTEILQRALALLNELQHQLTDVRAELAAYAASSRDAINAVNTPAMIGEHALMLGRRAGLYSRQLSPRTALC